MTFEWSEYLDVAQALSASSYDTSQGGLEARQRSAISRAYYAVFGSYFQRSALPVARGRGNPHKVLVDSLVTSEDIRLQSLGRRLAWLRVLRNRCDYDEEVAELEKHCSIAIAEAADLLSVTNRAIV